LQSSARAACAFSSLLSESVHDKTMLHRVVMKRSGRRAPAGDASDFTAADHLICTIVRQARNFPPATGILRVRAEGAALEVVPARSHVGYRDKNGAMKIGTGIPGAGSPGDISS